MAAAAAAVALPSGGASAPPARLASVPSALRQPLTPASLPPEVPPSTPEAIGDGVVLADPPAAWIVVDAESGAVLAGRNEHELLRPASLSKLLTALVAVRHLAAGSSVTTPPQVLRVPPLLLGMQPGQVWPLSTVLHALLLRSDNDAAVALAVDLGGSEHGFVPMLEREASRLGIDDGAVFQDPAGLDTAGSVDDGNLASPWDVAILARAVLAKPELARIVAERTWSGPGPDGVVRLQSIDDLLWKYPGAIGLKTGFTDEAQWTLAGAARRGNDEVICVEMDVAQDELWSDAAALLNLGFAALGHPGTRGLVGGGERLPPLPSVRRAEAAAAARAAAARAAAASDAAARASAAHHARSRAGSLGPVELAWAAVAALFGLVLVSRRRAARRRARRRARWVETGWR